MAESTSDSHLNFKNTQTIPNNGDDLITLPNIPIEIVSEEEMAFIEAALAAATRSSFSNSLLPSIRSWPSLSPARHNARSIRSVSVSSKRGLSDDCGDIEESGTLRRCNSNNSNSSQTKKVRVNDSFLNRFRSKRGLAVTDLTSTEWCEKQMELTLVLARRKVNKAMKAGQARHLKLEQEVVKKVEVRAESVEDKWALKLINFIMCANQLLIEGLTRELPLVGFAEGVWMVGVIDEIRMPVDSRTPILVETKTRVRESLPAEAQRRNGKLQLMCYKYLWDSLVTNKFPRGKFYDFFSLNPYGVLSHDIRERTADAGFPVQTLEDIVRCYENSCKMLPLSHSELLLRYELQKDHSLVGEVRFSYDSDWIDTQIRGSLEFWRGDREASYTPEEERWKCRHCQFASVCPGNPDFEIKPSSPIKTTSPSSSDSSSSIL